MTQITAARSNICTDEMQYVADKENFPVDKLRELITTGKIAIPHNIMRNATPVGIGAGLTVKVNANIGSSPYHMSLEDEKAKLDAAIRAKTDTIMDLSLGEILNDVRNMVLKYSSIPVGTVPIYQVGQNLAYSKRTIEDMTIDDFLSVMELQAKEGVDFMTIHSGVTRKAWELLKQQGRLLDVVSRGGSMLIKWMVANKAENPLYTHFDKILELAHEYDVTLSLGDGMRPGAIHDATDRGQIEELITLGELGQRCVEAEVQVMIEGPGHVPYNQIKTNMQIQKSLTSGLPFYVLGPLPTDIAPGYDHITGAIGGALAAISGADFLCYVTPAEHLRLPSPDDVFEGVIATRIAGHIADLANGIPQAHEWDLQMSAARKKLNWDKMFSLAIDPEKARRYRKESEITDEDFCTMCGEFCSVKNLQDL